MAKKSKLIFVFLAAVALGFLCELAPWQRGSIVTSDHPFIPISYGLVMLSVVLSKRPEVKQLRPTLLILAVSALAYGVREFMLDNERFHIYAGHRLVTFLDRFKFTVGGIAIGAVLSSLFYGHWTLALLVARQKQQLSATQKKID